MKHNQTETGEGNAPRVQPRIEFWAKDGFWHFIEPSGKWSAECFDSYKTAWQASNQMWELPINN